MLNSIYDASSILALTLLNPSTSLALTSEAVILQEESLAQFTLPRELLSLEGFRATLEFERDGEGTLLTVTAYDKCENELGEENYNQAHQIGRFTSHIVLDPDSPLPRQIAAFALPHELTRVHALKLPLVLLQTPTELLLCRLVLQGRQFQLVLHSKFSFDSDSYALFQNKLPLADLDHAPFMGQFAKKHRIRQVAPLDTTRSYTQSKNEFAVLYAGFALVLEVEGLVFKISQVLGFQAEGEQHIEQVDSILDNFQPGSAYLRGSNHLYILQRLPNSDKYAIRKDQPLDDTVVFASHIDNWGSRTRTVRLCDAQPLTETRSRLIVKEFGQLEAVTRRLGDGANETSSEVYL